MQVSSLTDKRFQYIFILLTIHYFSFRFTLATERLKGYLDPLLCTETPNVIHMQHYLSHSKNASDSKEQPSSKILSTYQVMQIVFVLFFSFIIFVY